MDEINIVSFLKCNQCERILQLDLDKEECVCSGCGSNNISPYDPYNER